LEVIVIALSLAGFLAYLNKLVFNCVKCNRVLGMNLIMNLENVEGAAFAYYKALCLELTKRSKARVNRFTKTLRITSKLWGAEG
jgi:hypothetical protein